MYINIYKLKEILNLKLIKKKYYIKSKYLEKI